MLRFLACLVWLAAESAVKLPADWLFSAGKWAHRAWTRNKVGEKLFPKITAHRRRKRRLRELGIEENSMALDLGTRTSTNTVVAAPILGTVYVNLIEMLPYPDLVAALTTPEMVVLATALFAWIVARFSKTPTDPGKL